MVWLYLQSRPPVVWVLLRLFSKLTPWFFLTNANDRFRVVFLWVQSHSSFLRCTILFRKKQKARHSDASHSETLRHLLEQAARHTPKCRGHCVFLTAAESSSSSFFQSLSRRPASSSQPHRIPFPTVPPVSLSLQFLPSTLSLPPFCFHLCQAFPSPLLFPSLSSISFSPPVSIFVKHSLLPSCFHLCQAFPSPLLFPSLPPDLFSNSPSLPHPSLQSSFPLLLPSPLLSPSSLPSTCTPPDLFFSSPSPITLFKVLPSTLFLSPPVSIFTKHSLLPSCFHLYQASPSPLLFPSLPSIPFSPPVSIFTKHPLLPSCFHLYQAFPSPLLFPSLPSIPFSPPVSIFTKHSLLPSCFHLYQAFPSPLLFPSLPSIPFSPPVSIFTKHSLLPSCFHLYQAFPSPLLFPSLPSIPFSPPVSIFTKHSLLPSCFHLYQAFPSPLLFPSLPSIPFSPPVSIFTKHSLLPSCFHFYQAFHYHWRELPQV